MVQWQTGSFGFVCYFLKDFVYFFKKNWSSFGLQKVEEGCGGFSCVVVPSPQGPYARRRPSPSLQHKRVLVCERVPIRPSLTPFSPPPIARTLPLPHPAAVASERSQNPIPTRQRLPPCCPPPLPGSATPARFVAIRRFCVCNHALCFAVAGVGGSG